MLRKLIYFLPLIVPLAVYALWFWAVVRRRAAAAGQEAPNFWDSAPFVWLLLIGVLLTAAGLFAWGVGDGIPADRMGDGIPDRPGVGQPAPPQQPEAAGGY